MLASYFGHWFNETVGFVAAARSAGIGIKVFAAREVDAEVARQTGALGVYALTQDIVNRYGVPSRYARGKLDPHCQPLIDFMAWSEACRQACVEIGNAGIGKDDLLLVPFAMIYELHGVAMWLETLPVERRPAVLFNFGEPHPPWRISDDRESVSGDFSLSRYTGRRLLSAVPEQRILLTAADRRLCAAMQNGLGLRCRQAPMMVYYDSELTDGDRHPPAVDRRHTLSIVGVLRAEHGRDLVLDALRAFAIQRPRTRLFVQLQTRDEAARLQDSVLQAAPGVELECQVGPLPRDAYYSRLRQSDLIVLPYSWRRYAMRTSGVFSEAVAYGIPVVAPARTWMADILEAGRGAGVTFSEWTPDAVAAAMVRALDRIDELKAKALPSSAAWRKEESVHAYLERVVEWWKSQVG